MTEQQRAALREMNEACANLNRAMRADKICPLQLMLEMAAGFREMDGGDWRIKADMTGHYWVERVDAPKRHA